MKEKNIIVTKASGAQDTYSEEKLRRSLKRSGAGKQVINTIIREIGTKLYNGISTATIYEEAFELLKKNSGSLAGRYNLKRAIMALGPSGFPFEQYIGAIFEWQGYRVKTRLFLQGVCVTHEIDVLAEKDGLALMIECKYHNNPGIVCDVKVSLYIQSRYQDVLGRWNKSTPDKMLEGYVVTNTKFSTDAVKYGLCAGLKLLGWNYPEKNSLGKLVDESGLYPVTCLTSLTNKEKEMILEGGTVLCRDLENKKELLQMAAISPTRMQTVLDEIKGLCKM